MCCAVARQVHETLHRVIVWFLRFLFFFFSSQTIYALGSGCRPGTFVNSIVLGCQTCPNGTFSNTYNATKCSICKECFGKRNKIAQACTLTSNTICKCQDGFYFNDFLYCLKCKPCKRRHGVKQNCSATSDTVCERCEKVGKHYVLCEWWTFNFSLRCQYTLHADRWWEYRRKSF